MMWARQIESYGVLLRRLITASLETQISLELRDELIYPLIFQGIQLFKLVSWEGKDPFSHDDTISHAGI